MVECYDCGGGSGIFGYVALFCLEPDRALGESCPGAIFTRERPVLKILGSISLGDRYEGKIIYKDKVLTIGPDEGRLKSLGGPSESCRKFPIL